MTQKEKETHREKRALKIGRTRKKIVFCQNCLLGKQQQTENSKYLKSVNIFFRDPSTKQEA